jgi:hypothetical protein
MSTKRREPPGDSLADIEAEVSAAELRLHALKQRAAAAREREEDRLVKHWEHVYRTTIRPFDNKDELKQAKKARDRLDGKRDQLGRQLASLQTELKANALHISKLEESRQIWCGNIRKSEPSREAKIRAVQSAGEKLLKIFGTRDYPPILLGVLPEEAKKNLHLACRAIDQGILASADSLILRLDATCNSWWTRPATSEIMHWVSHRPNLTRLTIQGFDRWCEARISADATPASILHDLGNEFRTSALAQPLTRLNEVVFKPFHSSESAFECCPLGKTKGELMHKILPFGSCSEKSRKEVLEEQLEQINKKRLVLFRMQNELQKLAEFKRRVKLEN